MRCKSIFYFILFYFIFISISLSYFFYFSSYFFSFSFYFFCYFFLFFYRPTLYRTTGLFGQKSLKEILILIRLVVCLQTPKNQEFGLEFCSDQQHSNVKQQPTWERFYSKMYKKLLWKQCVQLLTDEEELPYTWWAI